MRTTILLAAVALVALSGCRGGTSSEPPLEYPSKLVDRYFGIIRMEWQPKLKAQEKYDFFPNGMGNRVPPDGTVARGALKADDGFFRGLGPDGQPLGRYPVAVTRELVQRGEQRYNIYCAPCHDRTGSGEGLVPKRGWIKPPSFHDPRILAYTPGGLFGVVSHGIRTMPGYAKQIPEADRWAIVAWVQTLQRSSLAKLDDVPADQRGNIR